MLISCRECGAKISDSAVSCPKCGCQDPISDEDLARWWEEEFKEEIELLDKCEELGKKEPATEPPEVKVKKTIMLTVLVLVILFVVFMIVKWLI